VSYGDVDDGHYEHATSLLSGFTKSPRPTLLPRQQGWV